MALEDLTPEVREEEILNGSDIEPATRLEYFMKKAANEVPKPSTDDEGKTIEVDENGDYILKSLNIKNGEAAGSSRSVNSAAESADYQLGADAVALGNGTRASGTSAVAVGGNAVASGECAFAGGQYYQNEKTEASGDSAIAYGLCSTASGKCSAAFNQYATASGNSATAIGFHSTASGQLSFASGQRNTAEGTSAAVFGEYNTASHRDQIVMGKYAAADPSSAAATALGTYVLIVGNGTNGSPSNALTLDWAGNLELSGNLVLGKGTPDEVTLTPGNLKALLNLLVS